MTFGIFLKPMQGTIDLDGLRHLLAKLPGVRSFDPGDQATSANAIAVTLGGHTGNTSEPSVVVRATEANVCISFHYSDNPYGHGRLVGEWVLEHHSCSGRCIDYGTAFADSAACLKHLAVVANRKTHTPERCRECLEKHLLNARVARVSVDYSEIEIELCREEDSVSTLKIARSASLHVSGPGPDVNDGTGDDAVISALTFAMDLYVTIRRIDIGFGDALTLAFDDGFSSAFDLTITGDRATSGYTRLWSVEDPSGKLLILAHNGGGPCIAGDDDREL